MSVVEREVCIWGTRIFHNEQQINYTIPHEDIIGHILDSTHFCLLFKERALCFKFVSYPNIHEKIEKNTKVVSAPFLKHAERWETNEELVPNTTVVPLSTQWRIGTIVCSESGQDAPTLQYHQVMLRKKLACHLYS
jgi:hypothetical protein